MKTLKDISVAGKVVVVRADLNVPHKNGKVTESTRIKAFIPTLRYLLDEKAKEIHILTHLGRPKGQVVPELSTNLLVPEIESLIDEKVSFNTDFVTNGEKIQLHENVRFKAGEKKNEKSMQDKLKTIGGEVFVLDAFGTAHRDQASVVSLASSLPSAAGKLLEKEIQALTPFISKDQMPGLTVIVGGAKMETKIGILNHFALTAGNIIVGGALANTFLAAQGYDVGESLYEEDEMETAMEIMATASANGTGFHIPVDVIVADEIKSETALDLPIEDVIGDMKIFDIGQKTVASYKEIIAHSQVIIWNGPMGVTEFKLFQNGTKGLLEGLKASPAQVIVGGGDSIACINQFGFNASDFTHVSTGGGAMLEFLEGKTLPGVKAVS